jgi:single-strand DNA-binding protein
MASRTRTSKTSTESTTGTKFSRGSSVNRVILVGRLVANPELRETSNGIHVTTVRVATNDREQAEFHDVVLWRQHADFAVTYLTKGRQVYIEGRLQGRTWEAADGTQRRTVEVVADNFRVLSSKPSAEPAA